MGLFKNWTISPQEARQLISRSQIWDAGWHFSYVMDAAAISEKINSFSHQEFNTSEFVDVKAIEKRIANHADLFDRDSIPLQPTKIDDSFPRYLRDNREKYRGFILDV